MTCKAALTIAAYAADGPGVHLSLQCDREPGHTGPHYLVHRITDAVPRLQWSDDGRTVRAAWHDDLCSPPDPIRFGSHCAETTDEEVGAASQGIS